MLSTTHISSSPSSIQTMEGHFIYWKMKRYIFSSVCSYTNFTLLILPRTLHVSTAIRMSAHRKTSKQERKKTWAINEKQCKDKCILMHLVISTINLSTLNRNVWIVCYSRSIRGQDIAKWISVVYCVFVFFMCVLWFVSTCWRFTMNKCHMINKTIAGINNTYNVGLGPLFRIR